MYKSISYSKYKQHLLVTASNFFFFAIFMFYFIIPVFKGEDKQGDNKGYKTGFYVSGNT